MRSDVAYCSHIVFVYVIWFVFVENEIYCVSSCMFLPTLGQAAKFIAH